MPVASFYPPVYLRDPHVQTIVGNLPGRRPPPLPPAELALFTAPDGP